MLRLYTEIFAEKTRFVILNFFKNTVIYIKKEVFLFILYR